MPTRAILIDPQAKTVTETLFGKAPDWRAVRDALGCTYIARAGQLANGDQLYCDDEALLHNPQHFFLMATVNGQPIAGKALVLRHNEDEEAVTFAAAVSSVPDVEALVQFPNIQLADITHHHTMVAGVNVTTITPNFTDRQPSEK